VLDGGLISAPTLALIGEESGKREAVLPLDDPQAMRTIGQAIGQEGGGTTVHVHVEGMISPDNLNKVIGQINKMVNRGQATLHATSSLRVNKRSA